MKPPKVVSREYKIMMDHRLFADRKPAIDSFLAELKSLAEQVGTGYGSAELKTRKREIVFMDTQDSTILLNGLVLRRRTDMESGQVEYTLKYRSPDRYLAAAARIEPADSKKGRIKLEEDIGSPFRIQFSHSGTVAGPKSVPSTLKDAAEIFPGLAELQRDGEPCPASTRLYAVNAMTMFERVVKGPTLEFGSTKAEVALILWSNGESGRPQVAEFSFRYEDLDENYQEASVRKAKQLFEALQRLDWFMPEGKTKTQFAYHA